MTPVSPYDYLERAANTHPHAPALVRTTTTLTFSEPRRATRNIAGVLREHGIRAGDIVSTMLSPDSEWIVTLALLHEGAVTCSVWEESQLTLVRPSHFITDTPTVDSSRTTPTLVINDEWIRRVSEQDNSYAPVPYAGDDAMVRLVLTSGTTGIPKIARYNLGPIVRRNENLDNVWIPAVYLNMMAMSTMGAFYQAMVHLATATPYLVLSTIDRDAATLIADNAVNIIIGSPLSVGYLCEVVQASKTGVAPVAMVVVAGSTASRGLVGAINQTFGVDASLLYGSTEGGAITTGALKPGDDLRIVGYPYRGVSLQIVDEHDAPVPEGETGFIRYATADMIDGYFRDPAATAEAFRGGWFYPGDRGSMTADGRLMLAGRLDDILNVGGVKLDPLEIDVAVMGLPGVVDAASFVLDRVTAIPRLAVAIVGDSSLDLAAIDAHMRRTYPNRYPSVYLETVLIPRNAAGKIQRNTLENLVNESDVS
jgi:long-chain acyl-CoA synthetase